MFNMSSFLAMESCTFTVTAYDGYVAICHPLTWRWWGCGSAHCGPSTGCDTGPFLAAPGSTAGLAPLSLALA